MSLSVGINLSTSAAVGTDPAADAVRAEELGYDFVCVSDHLHGTHPSYETWTMLTWMAAATSTIHVVSNVLGLPYRSPAVLAKMAESLDRLSGGRLVIGLGAGGWDAEFSAFGLPVRTPKEKVDGLEDALQILRGLWREPTFTFHGPVYSVEDAELEPKPDRPVPVWVGGFGPRSLRVIGRLADGWLPSMPVVPPEEVSAKRAVIQVAAESAGRDPDELTYAYNISVHLGTGLVDDRVIGGSAAEVTDRIGALVTQLGLDAINVSFVGPGDDHAVAFATDVVPDLR
jgi:probable F420-dependent oxidoreductase